MKVKLTYFKQSGKYYSDGSYETNQTDLHNIFDEVRNKLTDGKLPGLVDGARYTTHIEVPDYPHDHPALFFYPQGFEELVERIKGVPITFLPALLLTVVEQAFQRNVFQRGGMVKVVTKKLEQLGGS